MQRPTPDFLVRRECDSDLAVWKMGMREQIFHRRHNFGNARFVVRAQQRCPGSGDDVIADPLGERRNLGRTQHDRPVVRQDDVGPVVALMHDRSNAGAGHFRRRVDVRDESDGRYVCRCRWNRCRHVPMLIDLYVPGAKGTKLGGEIVEQHELARRTRISG